jgi:predicted acyl esterase
LHPRGNFEGFVRAAAKHKWLEAHGIEHWTHFYTDYGREQQLRFFDHFLHGKKQGWAKQPKVLLQVRHVDKFQARAENEWPLKRTRWTKFYLDPVSMTLTTKKPSGNAQLKFPAMGDGLMFLTPPLAKKTEITGPSALKLFVSSSTPDADLFIVLRIFTGDLKEIVFQGAIDPHTPVAQGWLRASHRKLDRKLSKPYRPYHTHDEKQPLKKGQTVELDIEIWPTSIVVPAGYRIGLAVRGKDYEYGGASGGRLSNFKNELKGCGPFLHDDHRDRPPAIFNGTTSLHFGRGKAPYLLLPIVPPKKQAGGRK